MGWWDGFGIFAGAIGLYSQASDIKSVCVFFFLLLDRSWFSFLSGSTILSGAIPQAHQLLMINSNIQELYWLVMFKGALSGYLATFKKSKRCLRINWIPKLMIWFCHWRLFEVTETVSYLLSLRMKMDWNLKKLANYFKFWCYVFQKLSRNLLWLALCDKIHLISLS